MSTKETICNMKHVVNADAESQGDMVAVSIFYIQPMLTVCCAKSRCAGRAAEKAAATVMLSYKYVSTTFTSSSEGGKKEGSKPGAGTVYLMKCLISVNILIV